MTNVDKRLERDSRKDEAVVIMFIVATSGLLAWAVLRPWVQGWVEVSFTQRLPRGIEIVSADILSYRLRENEGATFRFRMAVEVLISNSIYALSLYNTIWIRLMLILRV